MSRLFSLPVLMVCLLGFSHSANADSLLLCGRDEVFAVDPEVLANGKLEKLWSWKAEGQKNLPADLVKTFATTDECKPIHDGRQVLITSSSSGCALVDYPTGEVRWFARVPNAHSIELLPNNRVVVAASVHKDGNQLVLFDLSRSNAPIWSTELISAHGVIWDAARESLWALGLEELRQYRLQDWHSKSPTLKLEQTFPLPDRGGHDLQAVPGSNDLVLTTEKTVSLFDREQGQFRPHPALNGYPHVKAVTIHPTSGKTFYVQAIGGKRWWSENLQSLTFPTSLSAHEEQLYKVRWLPAVKATAP